MRRDGPDLSRITIARDEEVAMMIAGWVRESGPLKGSDPSFSPILEATNPENAELSPEPTGILRRELGR